MSVCAGNVVTLLNVNYKVGKLLMTRAGWLWLCCPDTGQPCQSVFSFINYTGGAGAGGCIAMDKLGYTQMMLVLGL